MQYYPVNLDVKDRKCLVVGGGRVGARKVATLLECGADVTLVSPEAVQKITKLDAEGKIVWIRRRYESSDLSGMFLVIGATDNEGLNGKVHSDSQEQGVLCNIADRPKLCNFILPAIVDRGDLVIAVSTSGKSPAFAKRLRKDLEKCFGMEYAGFLRLMGAVREKLLSKEHAPEEHKGLFEQLIEAGLVEMIKEGEIQQIDELLSKVLGKGYKFDELMGK